MSGQRAAGEWFDGSDIIHYLKFRAMDIYEEITALRKQGRRGALATIIQVQGSVPSFETSKILIRDDGSIVGTVGGGCVEAEVWSVAQDVMKEERPRRLHFNLNQNPEYDEGLVCGGSLDIFIEPILAIPTLYLMGGGHVSLSIFKVAQAAGFETVICDDREAFANPERFPAAKATHAGAWEEMFPKLSPNSFSYLVIATRGHKGDLACLRWALTTQARYVGMVGSRRKLVEFFKVLEGEGVPLEILERVHSPVGLDIGAVTPGEIAVSVVAEMIAVRRNVMPSAASLAYQPKAHRSS
jgi:xanthine dehydrogenase accessory factor